VVVRDYPVFAPEPNLRGTPTQPPMLPVLSAPRALCSLSRPHVPALSQLVREQVLWPRDCGRLLVCFPYLASVVPATHP
jgi:hypothetical protein